MPVAVAFIVMSPVSPKPQLGFVPDAGVVFIVISFFSIVVFFVWCVDDYGPAAV